MYDDAYPTCAETYATLRVAGVAVERVTLTLGRAPNCVANVWLFSSKGQVDSRDVRRHIDWILDDLDTDSVSDLVASGARIDVFCYWVSAWGHGGPTVSTRQSARLAELGIDLGFDVYGSSRGADS